MIGLDRPATYSFEDKILEDNIKICYQGNHLVLSKPFYDEIPTDEAKDAWKEWAVAAYGYYSKFIEEDRSQGLLTHQKILKKKAILAAREHFKGVLSLDRELDWDEVGPKEIFPEGGVFKYVTLRRPEEVIAKKKRERKKKGDNLQPGENIYDVVKYKSTGVEKKSVVIEEGVSDYLTIGNDTKFVESKDSAEVESRVEDAYNTFDGDSIDMGDIFGDSESVIVSADILVEEEVSSIEDILKDIL